MSGPRVLVSHGANGRALAKRLVAALAQGGVDVAAEGHARPGKTLATRVRRELDACELLLVLYDEDAARSAWVHQEIGYALGQGRQIFVIAKTASDRALLTGTRSIAWPRGPDRVAAIARRIHRALPATPRAAVRSLAQTSEERWSRLVRAEVARELRARGWEALPVGGAWEGRKRIFVTSIADVVWRKKVRGRWLYLRTRAAPFNPVDLLSVRERAAPRVYEWWLLRTGRSDGWMQRLYGGAPEPLTSRTRFFGQREAPLVATNGAGALIRQRFLTERIERTGRLARELDAIEAWLAQATRRQRAPIVLAV